MWAGRSAAGYEMPFQRLISGMVQVKHTALLQFDINIKGINFIHMTKQADIYIGTDDFADLVLSSNVFVDKTLFVKEFLDDSGKVVLVTRPRRWGKSMNMSMLSKFLSIEVDQSGAPIAAEQSLNRKLFAGGEAVCPDTGEKKQLSPLKIASEESLMSIYQGKFPVISMSLKDVKDSTTYTELIAQLSKALVEVFERHSYLLQSSKLASHEKELLRRYLSEQVTHVDIREGVFFMSKVLYKHFGQPAYILIDEYDTPISSAYLEFKSEPEVFEKVVKLFRGLLDKALKGNQYLKKGLVTGILRIAGAQLFSDLNSIREYTILDNQFSASYGFTQAEVDALLEQVSTDTTAEQISHWYNGYTFGEEVLYNPWSIMCCLGNEGRLEHYWIDSGGTDLIDAVLLKDETQESLQQLVSGGSLERVIKKEIAFDKLDSSTGLYTLLLFSGYLNPKEIDHATQLYQLSVPNHEVQQIYRERILDWLDQRLEIYSEGYVLLAKLLLEGRLEEFEHKLQQFFQQATSLYQTGSAMAEVFYNGFMLCLLGMLSAYYRIEGEYESRGGRSDVVLVPKSDSNHQALILECKVAKSAKGLSALARDGLSQITARDYTSKVETYDHVQRILAVCVAFAGKKMALAFSTIPCYYED